MFACLMAGAPVQAHHSVAAIYDMSKAAELKGALTKIEFVNPHGSITVMVKNADGTTTDWTFTTGSATALANRGISKYGPNALKVGQELTVKYIPARDGNALGFLIGIKMPNGKFISMTPK